MKRLASTRKTPDRFAPDMRLLLLVRALEQSRSGLTIQDMGEAMAVDGRLPSRSTVERAKRAVSSAYPEIECLNAGEKGLVRWRLPGRLVRPIPVSADELAAIERAALSAKVNGQGLDVAPLKSVAVKLRAASHPDALRRAEPDAEALLEAEGIAHRPGPRQLVQPAIISVLRQAILEFREVRIAYYGRESGKLSQQTLSPLGFVHGGRNYLVAWSHGTRGIRNFALTNVRSATLLQEAACRPPGWQGISHHIRDWFGVYDEAPSDIVLRFSKQAAGDVASFIFHPSQTIQILKSGKVEVRFRAGGLEEISWHLAQWGRDVQVVAPERLRKLCRKL